MAPTFFTLINLTYMVVYKVRLPFFEKYKIMKTEQWPWVQDPEGWTALLKKSAPLLCFNLLFV